MWFVDSTSNAPRPAAKCRLVTRSAPVRAAGTDCGPSPMTRRHRPVRRQDLPRDVDGLHQFCQRNGDEDDEDATSAKSGGAFA